MKDSQPAPPQRNKKSSLIKTGDGRCSTCVLEGVLGISNSASSPSAHEHEHVIPQVCAYLLFREVQRGACALLKQHMDVLLVDVFVQEHAIFDPS